MTTNDGIGPFAADLPPVERAARARSLAALTMLFAGPCRADRHMGALRRLERDPEAAGEALVLCSTPLPARPRRHALCAYAALHRPR